MDYHTLFNKQQEGKDTDCSFELKNEDGSQGKTVHAHKLILTAASPVFEVNFKSEWEGDQPIPVKGYTYSVFNQLIRAIYLSEIYFKNLNEACELYEAAHFYQAEMVLDLLRNEIPIFCASKKPASISTLTNTARKYQDYKLIQFLTKYFSENAENIIINQDFLKLTPDSINFFFQLDDIAANELHLLKALEKYIASNQSVSTKTLKPAIGTIHFLSFRSKEYIEKTTLLTEIEKDFLLGKNTLNLVYLSKDRNTRKYPAHSAKMARKRSPSYAPDSDIYSPTSPSYRP